MSGVYYSAEKLSEELRLRRKDNKNFTVVFTNGCFDIIHPGHIHIIERSSSLGDLVIVGMNSDKSVRKIKGEGRPVMDEKSRAAVLAALKGVDYVMVFDEETPERVISFIRPDVLVKGSEYKEKDIVGREAAGRIVRVEMKKGYSTTKIIQKIKKADE